MIPTRFSALSSSVAFLTPLSPLIGVAHPRHVLVLAQTPLPALGLHLSQASQRAPAAFSDIPRSVHRHSRLRVRMGKTTTSTSTQRLWRPLAGHFSRKARRCLPCVLVLRRADQGLTGFELIRFHSLHCSRLMAQVTQPRRTTSYSHCRHQQTACAFRTKEAVIPGAQHRRCRRRSSLLGWNTFLRPLNER